MPESAQDSESIAMRTPQGGRLAPWLRMLRPPNLFTVPGDPAAGFALAVLTAGAPLTPANLLPAALAALLLYCAGLLANDYFDLEEDRRLRPERPLPRGQARPRTVLLAAIVLAALGVLSAWLAGGAWPAGVAAALAASVFIYDGGGKRVPLWGPLNMGLCRGLSFLLGSAAGGAFPLAGTWRANEPALVLSCFAAGLTLHVAAVTALAARETGGRVGLRRLLPVGTMALWLTATNASLALVPLTQLTSCVLQILALMWTVKCASDLRGRPEPALVGRTVGRHIRGLLLVQAAVVVLAEAYWPVHAWAAAALLLAFWPASALTARRFYAS